jgi:D-inositol-3-phosphate glycosyltransferase
MLKIAMVAEQTETRREDPGLDALSGALADAGHEVALVTRDHRAALKSIQPDVIHAHSCSPRLLDVVRRFDVPFVLTVHSPGADLTLLRPADHVITTYTAQLPSVLAAGVRRENVSVVPYGVDVDHFTPDGPRADRQRPRRVVALGEMAPASGFGTTVAALPALPDTELVLVGGPRRGTHAGELRDYASSLGVADQLRLPGPVPRAELPALLRSADLLVCSPWEPIFGIAALKAMACGLAVIANGVGGLADTVVDSVTGTHVAPRKPRQLAAALRRVLSNSVIREQQGAAGCDRVTARYSWRRIATETLQAYRRAGAADPVVLAREAAAAARKNASRDARRVTTAAGAS